MKLRLRSRPAGLKPIYFPPLTAQLKLWPFKSANFSARQPGLPTAEEGAVDGEVARAVGKEQKSQGEEAEREFEAVRPG